MVKQAEKEAARRAKQAEEEEAACRAKEVKEEVACLDKKMRLLKVMISLSKGASQF